jgi:hypothetical protein
MSTGPRKDRIALASGSGRAVVLTALLALVILALLAGAGFLFKVALAGDAPLWLPVVVLLILAGFVAAAPHLVGQLGSGLEIDRAARTLTVMNRRLWGNQTRTVPFADVEAVAVDVVKFGRHLKGRMYFPRLDFARAEAGWPARYSLFGLTGEDREAVEALARRISAASGIPYKGIEEG